MSIRRYASYNLLAALVPILVSIATIPLYLKLIGLERYGVLAICWVLVGYFGLFEFGLGPATAQRIASLGSKSADERSATAWAALILSLMFGLVGGLIVLVVGGPLLQSIRSVGAGLQSELHASVPWLALLIPVTTLNGVLAGALQGRDRFKETNLIGACGHAVASAAPLLTAWVEGPHLPNLIATVLAARVVNCVALFAACRRFVPLGSPSRPDGRRLRSLTKFGGWVTATGVLVPVLTNGEKFALGWMVGAAAVSSYMIPFNLISRLLVIPQSVASALFPRFARIAETDVDATEQRAIYLLTTLLAPLLIINIIGLPLFLHFWVGSAVAQQSWPIGVVLIAGIWFNCCSFIPHSRLQGRGRPEAVTKISLMQLPFYLPALYLGIRYAGPIGAAAIWSLRVGLEMFVFFAATGQSRRLLSVVWLPSIAVLAAAAIALALPFPDLTGLAFQMLLLVPLAGIAAVRAYREWPMARSAGIDGASLV